MNRKELTVDLAEERERITEQLEEVNNERREVVEEYNAYDDDSDVPSSLEQRWEELEAERVRHERREERFGEVIEELSSTEFVIRELSFGQVQAVQDIVSEQSFDVDIQSQSIDGTPLQGVYRSEFMQRAIVDSPDEIEDPMDLPDVVGEWLWEKIDAFNTSGGETMGNMSLEEASEMEEI